MANGKPDQPSDGRRRREPPTIDLTAKEVTASRASEMPKPETSETSEASPQAEADGNATTERAPPPAGASAKPSRTASIALFAGGVAAGIAALVAVLWLAGSFRVRDEATVAMGARLAQMELQLRDLAARPVPMPADPKPLDDVAARLSRLEQSLAARLAGAETAAKSAADGAALANRRIDETAALARDARSQADAAASTASRNSGDAARTDLAALTARLAAVEAGAKAADAELAKRAAADDRAGRLAIAATSLRAAVDRGDAFAGELAAAKALSSDAKVLAPLDPYAASGVPSRAALAREIGQLVPALRNAAGPPPAESGLIDKLQAHAERLVRIRPIADSPGDDAAAVIARVEFRSTQNDIAGMLAELRKLPPHVRAPAESWMRRAEGRDAAAEAARQFAANALAALGKSGS